MLPPSTDRRQCGCGVRPLIDPLTADVDGGAGAKIHVLRLISLTVPPAARITPSILKSWRVGVDGIGLNRERAARRQIEGRALLEREALRDIEFDLAEARGPSTSESR